MQSLVNAASDISRAGNASQVGRGPLKRMKIGAKLNLGFGVLLLLIFAVIALSYFASEQANLKMTRTTDLRAPLTLASSRAQANLLKMLADVRGYLALGDKSYREGYSDSRAAFEEDLKTLDQLGRQSPESKDQFAVPENYGPRLDALKSSFFEWVKLPEQLFTLRDDQLEREPGLKLLIKEGSRPIAQIVVAIKKMIETQRRREPTTRNTALFADMAAFQSSFFAMVAGLRGYVTTARTNFKFEYTSNLVINRRAMQRLLAGEANLSGPQTKQLKLIATVHEGFLSLPERIFEWVEGDRRRMDLFLFRTRAVPPAKIMLQLLGEISAEQQRLLQSDLSEGRIQLTETQRQLVLTGFVAFVLALGLVFVFRANIVGPIQRLTRVAQRVGSGDLSAQARQESLDEIGTLARTFNEMNARLRETLDDLEERRKKEEATAETFRRQNEYLGALHDTTLGLMSRLDLGELLSDLTARAGQLLNTRHGYIYLVDEGGQTLERKIGVGAYKSSIGLTLEPQVGVAGRVWQNGEPLVINGYDTWEGRATVYEYEVTIRAIMGVPLKSGDDVIGVLGMAYDAESQRSFGAGEVELLSRFAQLASIALDNAQLYTTAQEAMTRTEEARRRVSEQNRMLEGLSTQLSKYLSPQVYSSIFSGKQSVEIASKRKKLTVFFSDIAGFTETTDSLESEELTSLLNQYLTEMSKIALDHGATIDKYIGDAILAFFGDPESRGVKEDATACVQMAIAMQRRMRELQSHWLDLGLEKPFQLRIGINTGYCTVGNFGSADRMDYTIIGNEVNLASRLESSADEGGILIAHETYSLIKDSVLAEEQSPITVKGFAKPIRTYWVVGIYDDLEQEGQIIRKEQDGIKIMVELGQRDKECAIRAIEDMLSELKR